jgi:hypothetical protein
VLSSVSTRVTEGSAAVTTRILRSAAAIHWKSGAQNAEISPQVYSPGPCALRRVREPVLSLSAISMRPSADDVVICCRSG